MSSAEQALPPYSRDPETTSIRSAAPSYVSEVPSYHSRRAAVDRNECPSQRPASRGNRNPVLSPYAAGTSNISWSSIQGHQSRAYLSVASRRAAKPQCPSFALPAQHSLRSTALTPQPDSRALSAEDRRARDEEALQEENKSWEFMLSQMADWDERERDWRKFKASVEERRKGTRPGWMRFRKGVQR